MSSPCDALHRVDRLWRCTGCGYFAWSMPAEDVVDDGGCEIGAMQHVCPTCGEQNWHWCGGDSRDKRLEYAKEAGLD